MEALSTGFEGTVDSSGGGEVSHEFGDLPPSPLEGLPYPELSPAYPDTLPGQENIRTRLKRVIEGNTAPPVISTEDRNSFTEVCSVIGEVLLDAMTPLDIPSSQLTAGPGVNDGLTPKPGIYYYWENLIP